jgi:arsenate reductase
MAEGWARALHGGKLEACSAGIVAKGLDPRAVRVMAEAGVDISGQRSETADSYLDAGMNFVVTVCSHAHETCPHFPGSARVFHQDFDDPPHLTREMNAEEEILAVYRRVRDEIMLFIEALPETLTANTYNGTEQ